MFLHVFTDLPEVYSETQTAIAGWRKILAVLDLPVEVVEPADGVELPRGALSVEAATCATATGRAPRCCTASRWRCPAGGHVAIVGETGCGKTTFVKLLSRLADPRAGSVADRRNATCAR